uniref:ATP-dependent DNA helicase n=1 Tax=Tanacetum cinerariifolium TaxID=118510 RepID=A0A6L2K7J6_TANCI|nr:PIF1-like helicase [Tanacetum cinerariifolium]
MIKQSSKHHYTLLSTKVSVVTGHRATNTTLKTGDDDMQNGIVGAVPILSDDAGNKEFIVALVANVKAMIEADRKLFVYHFVKSVVVRRWKDNTFLVRYHNQCSGRFNVPYRTWQDICRTYPSLVFEGKVVLFGGDFRQILSVITNGGRHDLVNATINASYMWDNCTVLRLTVNMRTYPSLVFEGKVVLFGCDFRQILSVITNGGRHDLVNATINASYMWDNCTVLRGGEKEYTSLDSVCLADEDSNFDDSIYATEFLNGLRMSGIPHNNIKLKIGTHVMLMHNIEQRAGLCNETSLQVLRMGNNIIEAKIISRGVLV